MIIMGILNQNLAATGVPVYQSSRLLSNGQTLEITFDNPATSESGLPTDVIVGGSYVYGKINPLGLKPTFVIRPEKSAAVLDVSWDNNDTSWGNSFGSTVPFNNQSVTNQSTFNAQFSLVSGSHPSLVYESLVSRFPTTSANSFEYAVLVKNPTNYLLRIISYDQGTNSWSASNNDLTFSAASNYAICALPDSVVAVADETNEQITLVRYDSGLETWSTLAGSTAFPISGMQKPSMALYRNDYSSNTHDLAIFDSGTALLRIIRVNYNDNSWSQIDSTSISVTAGTDSIMTPRVMNTEVGFQASEGVIFYDRDNEEIRTYSAYPPAQDYALAVASTAQFMSMCSMSYTDFAVSFSDENQIRSYRILDDNSIVSYGTTSILSPLLALCSQATLGTVGGHRILCIDSDYNVSLRKW